MLTNDPPVSSRRARVRSLRRDDRAVTMMEELPPFLVVTFAVAIFLVTSTRAVVGYQDTVNGMDLMAEAREALQNLRVHPVFLLDASASSGEFSYTKVAEAAERADTDPGGVLDALAVREPGGVRVRDVSGYRLDGDTCTTDPCVVFEAERVHPDLVGEDRVLLTSSVTLRVTSHEVRAAILEVTLWR